MKKISGIIAFLAFGTLWISAQSAPATAAQSAPFSLKVSTTAEQFRLGAAINLQISLTNTSGRKIYVQRANGGLAEAEFDVFAKDDSGVSAPESSYYRVLKGRPPRDSSEPKFIVRYSFQVVAAQPGESLQSSIDLSKIFDFDRQGKYNVWVVRNDSASKSRVKSNVITVVISQ